ncbi:hypothetical protein [Eupransor demetentiae]|uniref:Uncharacterized protein n=1 Tax=Eupransor demetentiae TaxID=3109584 RepID=A0ABP0EPT5_9LACO|nr:hypothetical protein R54876_GBNLAHCA_00842 [Lactobacillaceae bacterium LMG 33000]
MDFEAALNDLKDGKIDKIEISPENFVAFQRAWHDFAYQNTVQGVAHRGGKVTYLRVK